TNVPLGPAVVVQVQDDFGNVVPTSNGPISLTLLNAPAGTALKGTLSATPVNGVATFSNLLLSKPGSNLRLLALTQTLPSAGSTAFNVVTPSKFTITPSVNTPVTAGAAVTYTVKAMPRSGAVPVDYDGLVNLSVTDKRATLSDLSPVPSTLMLT